MGAFHVHSGFPRQVSNKMEQENLPSIPILSCRWGLGEGVSPDVFEPLPVPPHLLRTTEPPRSDVGRRLRGRGRAGAGLSDHEDDLRAPGDLTNVGVTSLSISEQLNRVREDLPILEPSTDYRRYILPRSAGDEDQAARPAPRRMTAALNPTSGCRRDWSDVLDPWGEVTAAECSLLQQNRADAAPLGGADAGLSAPRRPGQSADSDPDVLEECTNSSDMSSEWQPMRSWRPRPPPLNDQSFPPLLNASSTTPAPVPVPVRAQAGSSKWPAHPRMDHATSQTGSGASAAGLVATEAQSKRKAGRRGRKKQHDSAAPTSTAITTAAATTTPAGAATGTLNPETASASEEAPSGQLHATGVTDDNWSKVVEYLGLYGTVTDERRGPDGDGWLTLSPPESAEWVLSVHSAGPVSDDLPGVQFQLASGGQ